METALLKVHLGHNFSMKSIVVYAMFVVIVMSVLTFHTFTGCFDNL